MFFDLEQENLILVERHEIYSLITKGIRKKITFISSPLGYGKTTAVAMWARLQAGLNIRYLEILKDLPEFESFMDVKTVLVVDGLHLYDVQGLDSLISYIKDSPSSISFILISRGELPDPLNAYIAVRQIDFITTKELSFSADECDTLLCESDIDLDDYDINEIVNETDGQILLLNALVVAIKNYEGYSRTALNKAKLDSFNSIDQMVWKDTLLRYREFLVKLSLFDSFSPAFAILITGWADGDLMLQKIRQDTGIINQYQDSYTFRPFFREYLQHKAREILSEHEVSLMLQNGGLWYATKGDIRSALHYYFLAKDFDKAVPLLVEVSNHHAGASKFYELEPYFTGLPKEILEEDPTLVASMAMVNSINFRVEESNKWYEKLKAMKRRLSRDDPRYELCCNKLLYLQIALPQTGGTKLAAILISAAKDTLNGGITIQPTAVTGNGPSFMSGGKDFCRWSKQARRLRKILKHTLTIVLGSCGVGVADIGVAETCYEQGDVTTALIELTKGINECNKGAPPENWYVAYTLMARIMTASCQLEAVPPILQNILQKIESGGTDYLLSNFEATTIRFSLYQNELKAVQRWFNKGVTLDSPGIRSFDRYQVLTRIRVCILYEQYERAVVLINKWEPYFKAYERTFNQIESKVLQAIALDPLDADYALKVFGEAVSMAREYKFVRVFADEGCRAFELIKRYVKAHSVSKDEFVTRIYNETKKMALAYPNYLILPRAITEKLTRAEGEILTLLAHGRSNGEIARFLDISLNTVKTHIKNVYQKLAVNSRSMAVKVAIENRLI